MDLIIKYLFGIPNVAVVSDSELHSRYNGYMSDKLFVVFNELSQLKESRREAQIKIKGMVTENMLMMEKKFQDTVAIRNYFNVIFIFFNNFNPLFMDILLVVRIEPVFVPTSGTLGTPGSLVCPNIYAIVGIPCSGSNP